MRPFEGISHVIWEYFWFANISYYRIFQVLYIRSIVYFHVHIVTAIVIAPQRYSANIADHYEVFNFSKIFVKRN